MVDSHMLAVTDTLRIARFLVYLGLAFCSPLLASDNSPIVIGFENLEWGPPGGGNGFPVGLRTSRISVDSETGAPTYYAMFPPGTHYDLHWHTHDEYVVVVAGKISMQLGEEHYDLEVGDYVVIPGEVNHSWTVPEGVTNAAILVRRVGAPDFFFVEEP